LFTHAIEKLAPSAEIVFDPFASPDQATITNSNGKVIYDSGCKNNPSEKMAPIPLQLDAPQNSLLTVSIKHNCDGQRNNSAWFFNLKCQKEERKACSPQFQTLINALKNEVTILKKILMHYNFEFECLISLSAHLREKLAANHLVDRNSSAANYGICSIMDNKCESLIRDLRKKDSRKITKAPPKIENKIIIDPFLGCGPKPKKDAPIFTRISWSYCSVGWKRLGLFD
jgi:hypothetical protein